MRVRTALVAAALSAAALTVAAPVAAFASSHTSATTAQAKPADECTPYSCENSDDWFYFEDPAPAA